MKVTAIYGTERKGCTWHIAQEVLQGLAGAEVREFFLPRDCPEFCSSCFACFTGPENSCIRSQFARTILEALLEADVILLTSPVYAYHLSGQMKTFLDHYANIWMVHRPREEMFRKQGVVIATAAGPVFRKTLGEMKDSLDFWGVSRTYTLGTALMQTNWDEVKSDVKEKVERRTAQIAQKLNGGAEGPCFRVRKWFFLSRFMQKYIRLNPVDVAYWEEKGWCGGVRPWKKK